MTHEATRKPAWRSKAAIALTATLIATAVLALAQPAPPGAPTDRPMMRGMEGMRANLSLVPAEMMNATGAELERLYLTHLIHENHMAMGMAMMVPEKTMRPALATLARSIVTTHAGEFDAAAALLVAERCVQPGMERAPRAYGGDGLAGRQGSDFFTSGSWTGGLFGGRAGSAWPTGGTDGYAGMRGAGRGALATCAPATSGMMGNMTMGGTMGMGPGPHMGNMTGNATMGSMMGTDGRPMHEAMMAKMQALHNQSGDDFDKTMLASLFDTHRKGVQMSWLVANRNVDPQVRELARQVYQEQGQILVSLSQMRNAWYPDSTPGGAPTPAGASNASGAPPAPRVVGRGGY